jgi:hypothetical protein
LFLLKKTFIQNKSVAGTELNVYKKVGGKLRNYFQI